MMKQQDELERIKNAYNKRKNDFLYHPMNPYVVMSEQEKERAIMSIFRRIDFGELNNKQVLEIGCGKGLNLLLLIKLGFSPGNIFANELIEERINIAKVILPAGVNFIYGNALEIQANIKFDLIIQSTVFTSILDYQFKKKLADKMWSLLKTDGSILWYDFIYNNPKNKNVKGITFSEIKKLFPKGEIKKNKITLAPPIGRKAIQIHTSLYSILNCFPFLKTHLLCWIKKSE